MAGANTPAQIPATHRMELRCKVQTACYRSGRLRLRAGVQCSSGTVFVFHHHRMHCRYPKYSNHQSHSPQLRGLFRCVYGNEGTTSVPTPSKAPSITQLPHSNRYVWVWPIDETDHNGTFSDYPESPVTHPKTGSNYLFSNPQIFAIRFNFNQLISI